MSVLKPGMLCYLKNCVIPENNGKVVTLIEHLGVVEYRELDRSIGKYDAWRVDKKLPSLFGVGTSFVKTSQLTPILPDGLNDEEDVFSSKPLSYEKEKENESVH